MAAALPWPPGWREPTGIGCLLAGAALPLALLVVVVGAAGLAESEPLAAASAALLGAALLALVPGWLPRFLDGKVHHHGGALVVPQSRLRALGPALAGLAFGASAIAGAVWQRDLVVGAIGVAAVAAAAYVLPRRWHARLVLAPDGVTYEVGRKSAAVAWDDVAEVVAHDQVIRTHYATRHRPILAVDAVTRAAVRRTGGGPPRPTPHDLSIPAAGLGLEPPLTYWTLRYYLGHPEARAELADGTALDRVRRHDVLA